MADLEAKNQAIAEMQEMAKIREETNREEQQKALEEYQKKAEAEAQRQQAELQETVYCYH